MPFISTNSFLLIGTESTRGTLASTLVGLPVTTPQVTPQQKFLRDEALRGSPTTVYNHVLGVRHDEYDFKTYMFADTFPYLAKAIFGQETKTGSTVPYSHKMQLLNKPSTGSQPSSLSIQDFDGQQAFQILGAQAAEMKLTFGAEAAVEVSAKFIGNPFTTITTPTVGSSFSTVQQVPGWNVTAVIGGTSLATIVDGEINFARSTAPIFTQGTKAPYQNFSGPLEITGRIKTVVESDSNFLINSQYGLTESPVSFAMNFTDSVTTTNNVYFLATATQFHDVKRTRDKQFVEVDAQFTCEANATDAATYSAGPPVIGGGYSPGHLTINNSVTTTY
jgi:hypothetical protein